MKKPSKSLFTISVIHLRPEVETALRAALEAEREENKRLVAELKKLKREMDSMASDNIAMQNRIFEYEEGIRIPHRK